MSLGKLFSRNTLNASGSQKKKRKKKRKKNWLV
jgi:hypothetical protein